MTLAQETRYYSPEEYLELEVNSEIRHEYPFFLGGVNSYPR